MFPRDALHPLQLFQHRVVEDTKVLELLLTIREDDSVRTNDVDVGGED